MRSEESASMAAGLASRSTRLTLQPADELVECELLRQVITRAGGRHGACDRSSRSNGLGDGCSNRAGDRNGSVSAEDRRSRNNRRGGNSRCGRRSAGLGAEESRTGDYVVYGGGVGVKQDAGIVALVQFRADDTFGLLGSAACDFDVREGC
jgi:hypothetical protein